MKIKFPFSRLLRTFDETDHPESDDPDLIRKDAFDFAKEARKGLMIFGLTDIFGIKPPVQKGLRWWQVWLESHDHIKGEIDRGKQVEECVVLQEI